MVGQTTDGKDVTDEESKKVDTIYCARNQTLDIPLLYVYKQNKFTEDGYFDLDPDANPKTIRILPIPVAKPLLFKSLTSGIYKLEGERLWIAFRQAVPAPEKFESTPGSGVTLLELQRSEPKKEEQAEAKTSGQNAAVESVEVKKAQDAEEKK